MSIPTRFVHVLTLPAFSTPRIAKAFLQDLRQHVDDVVRPRFVLDCSGVNLTFASIQLIVCVLEQAIKSNGDVRLAGLNPAAKASLVSAGASRLFETFSSVDLAVSSYRRAASLAPFETAGMSELYATEEAA